jgi:hypothetical protein
MLIMSYIHNLLFHRWQIVALPVTVCMAQQAAATTASLAKKYGADITVVGTFTI